LPNQTWFHKAASSQHKLKTLNFSRPICLESARTAVEASHDDDDDDDDDEYQLHMSESLYVWLSSVCVNNLDRCSDALTIRQIRRRSHNLRHRRWISLSERATKEMMSHPAAEREPFVYGLSMNVSSVVASVAAAAAAVRRLYIYCETVSL